MGETHKKPFGAEESVAALLTAAALNRAYTHIPDKETALSVTHTSYRRTGEALITGDAEVLKEKPHD